MKHRLPKLLICPISPIRLISLILFWKRFSPRQKLYFELILGALLLILIPLAISSLQTPNKAKAAWYDDNWYYRQAIPVTSTNGSAQTNVFISFTLDTATLITAGQLQSACQDIRLTDNSGNLLPYHVGRTNTCNNAATTIDFLLSSFPDKTSNYYVYYGNPSAVSADHGAFTESQAANYTVGTLASAEKGPSPVAYWKFDEGYGATAHDSTTNGNNGTLSGTTKPAWLPESQCVSGKCLYFDGSSSYITNTLSPSIANSSYTFSVWAFGIAGSNSNPDIFSIGTSRTTRNAIDFYIDSNNAIEYGIYAGNVVTANNTWTWNKWHYVTFVYDSGAGQGYIYLDGVQLKAAAMGNYTGSMTFHVGNSSSTGSNWWQGYVDEVKVYNFALSSSQVKQNYNAASQNAASGNGGSVLGANNQASLVNGLAAYFPYDGSLYSIDKAYIASWQGGTAAYATGEFGQSAQFTIGSGYGLIESTGGIADYSGFKGNDFSYSFWVDYRDTSIYTIFSQDVANTSGFVIHGDSSGHVVLRTDGSNTFQELTSSSTLSTGTWYHVVVTYDSSTTTGKIYINGTLDNSGSLNYTPYTGGTYGPQIEAWAYGTGSDMNLDEVRIYNRALLPSEVSTLYNSAPGPVGYWKMDEGTGSSANDSSTYGNTGTLTGSTDLPTWTTGKYGKAVNLDGTDDFVQLPSGNLVGTGNTPLTAEFWLYNTKTLGNGQAYLPIRLSQTTQFFLAFYETSGTFYIYPAFRGQTQLGTSQTQSNFLNQWVHIAVTYNGGDKSTASSFQIYVNAVPIAQGSANFGAAGGNCNDNAIGADATTSCAAPQNLVQGKMDDVRIYNYARTQKQIVSDMNAGHPSVGSPIGSPVGYWKFDEGYGATANNSGNGGSTDNGTLSCTGAGCSNPTWTNSGKFGKALVFDGTGSYADAGADSSLDPSSGVTVSAWIYPTSDGGNTGVIGRYKGGSIPNSTYWLGLTSLKPWIVTDTSGEVGTTATTAISTNAWHYIAGVYDSSLGKQYLYVDGVQVASSSQTGSLNSNSTHTFIGAITSSTGTPSGLFPGYIDEAKVYSYPLTASEVALDYNRGSAQVIGALGTNSSYQPQAANQEYCIPGDTASCAAPVGRWDFEEGTGTTVNDTSDNGNTGTWSGSGTKHWAVGKIGTAGNFNGSDDAVSLTTAFDPSQTGYSIFAWVYITGFQQQVIFSSDHEYNFDGGLSFDFPGSTGQFRAEFSAGGSSKGSISSTSNVSLNEWSYIGLVKSSSTVTLYLNGTAVGSTTLSGTPQNAASPVSEIGNMHSTSLGLKGKIDSVRIYNYARSVPQIEWDYDRGAPVAWWKFDECQGTIAHDSSGNGNTGTITIGSGGSQTQAGTCTDGNTAHAWNNGVNGKLNYSLNFDGTDDYIDVANPSNGYLDPSNLTVSAWVKLTSTSGYLTIVSKQAATTWTAPYATYNLRFDGPDTKFEFWADDYPNPGVESTTTPTTGTWYYVVGTYDGSNLKIYVNGVLEGTKARSGTNPSSSYDFAVGSHGTGTNAGEYFPGQIDDARIYNYALTATQVKNLYNNGAVNYAPVTGAP